MNSQESASGCDAGHLARSLAEALARTSAGKPALCKYSGCAAGQRRQTWPGLIVESARWHIAPRAEGVVRLPWHVIYVTLAGGTRRTVTRTDGVVGMDGPELAGRISFVPADRERWGWYEGAWMEFAAILLDPQWIARALERDGIAVPMQWRSVDNVRDPFILGAARALVDEMETGGVAGPLLAQSVALSLALHVVRRYSDSAPCLRERPELSRKRIARVLDFIHDHLDQPIALADLAAVAELGLYGFLRTFKRSVGVSPHRYLVERRIERARVLLETTDDPIAEIAAAVGLSSQSHLTTLFRKHLGTTPGKFRRSRRSLPGANS